jgi:tRNA modification GTPase
VRLSGAAAKGIAEGLVRLKRPLEVGRARFGEVVEYAEDGIADSVKTHISESRCGAPGFVPSAAAVLDQAVVTYFAGPRSYTGEDVVEIAVHGAPVLLDALVRRCVAAGARLAGPGEFTQRAFFAGKLDLTQAEAVDDLIQATTLEQARTAARQMGGGLSRQVRPVKERLIELIAEMEAGIDFAEDDLEVMGATEILRVLQEIEAPLLAMEQSFAYGRVLREGFKLAIVGRPNAGKSSLFNRLIRRDRAIVTAQPGTTRDPVAERLEFAGIPVEVVDTAGLRMATASGTDLDEAEAMGVAKSREAMAEADVVLLVVAADAGFCEEDWEVVRGVGGASAAGLVVVWNKVDLVRATADPSTAALRAFAQDDTLLRGGTGLVVETSAVEGTGIEELRAAVLGALKAIAPEADTAPLTNMRQHGAIGAALRSVRAARSGVEHMVPHEMVLIDLHEALGALDTLTGTTHTEEILGVIFSRFCIGK